MVAQDRHGLTSSGLVPMALYVEATQPQGQVDHGKRDAIRAVHGGCQGRGQICCPTVACDDRIGS
jgi:hypothetical protein